VQAAPGEEVRKVAAHRQEQKLAPLMR